jgi:hypothetical protein
MLSNEINEIMVLIGYQLESAAERRREKAEAIWQRLHEDVSAKLRSIGFHGGHDSSL